MFSMSEEAIRLATLLRNDCDLLVAGGPLPTLFPDYYLHAFDAVCLGEGEETMLDITQAHLKGKELTAIKGACVKGNQDASASDESVVRASPRPPIQDLDSIPFPARDLFDNAAYQEYFLRHFGRKETSIITTRGCPYDCDFCSRPVFSDCFRARSAKNVVEELKQISELDYDWVWFSDDCFTLSQSRVIEICQEIRELNLDLKWECLSRVDSFKSDTAKEMAAAGCERVFFGIESGNDAILREMRKQISVAQAKRAVETAVEAGLKAAGFFMIGYPGETDSTILQTIKFATKLPFDYVSFSLPYPIPGTGLYEKVKDKLRETESNHSSWRLIDHSLLYDGVFSEFKLKFGIAKAAIQHRIWKHTGKRGYSILGTPFEAITDFTFMKLK